MLSGWEGLCSLFPVTKINTSQSRLSVWSCMQKRVDSVFLRVCYSALVASEWVGIGIVKLGRFANLSRGRSLVYVGRWPVTQLFGHPEEVCSATESLSLPLLEWCVLCWLECIQVDYYLTTWFSYSAWVCTNKQTHRTRVLNVDLITRQFTWTPILLSLTYRKLIQFIYLTLFIQMLPAGDDSRCPSEVL